MTSTTTKKNYLVPAVFIWIGFVGAISFMEAWLKFQAPGITLELGLSIGSLVFSALNKVELVLALIILIEILRTWSSFSMRRIWLLVPIAILLLGTFWLLPQLNSRAMTIVQGLPVQRSNLHFYFVLLEVLKVATLAVFGFLESNQTQDKIST